MQARTPKKGKVGIPKRERWRKIGIQEKKERKAKIGVKKGKDRDPQKGEDRKRWGFQKR